MEEIMSNENIKEKEVIKLIENYMNTPFGDLLSLSCSISNAQYTTYPHILKKYSSEYLFDKSFDTIYKEISNESYDNKNLIVEKCIKRRESIIKLNKDDFSDEEYFIIKTIHKYIEMLLKYEILWCFENLQKITNNNLDLNPEELYIYEYLLKLGEMYLSLTDKYFVKLNKDIYKKNLKRNRKNECSNYRI